MESQWGFAAVFKTLALSVARATEGCATGNAFVTAGAGVHKNCEH